MALIVILMVIYFPSSSTIGAADINTYRTVASGKVVNVRVSENAPPESADSWEMAAGDSAITALLPSPNWIATGENSNDHFGSSVATAGDVNGDSYADIIVGAPYYPGSNEVGKTYVYYGSSSGLNATFGWTATGKDDWDTFGESVATAGDVNGDGYADVIVQTANPNTGKGEVLVYYGSSSGLNTTPGWTAIETGIGFGGSVASAGDVDGDGYADVIVGALGYGTLQGKVFVYYGSPSGPSITPDWTDIGEYSYNRFGSSVASAGDVNGDGYADIIVGASRYYYGAGFEGRIYVYHGSPSGLNSTPNWIATGGSYEEYFGTCVASAGDVNGDGYSDVIVGAYNYDDSGNDEARGKAYVYYGSSSGLSVAPDWTDIGEYVNDSFGWSVASAGDVNGDGYAEIIVGTPGYSGLNGQGKTYVYYGSSAGLNATPGWTAVGEANNDSFGSSVASAGDVNGDGRADIVVGASMNDGGSNNAGKVYVYHGQILSLIRGRVMNGDGDPVAGVQITASGGYSATTDADGQYTIADVPPDTYTLTPATPGYFWSPSSRTINVPPDAAGQDFTGRNVFKQSMTRSHQAVDYGESITYTVQFVFPDSRTMGIYDRVPTYTTYISNSLSGPAGVFYDPISEVISGTLTLMATVPETVTFSARVEVAGTLDLAPIIVNRACVYPVGGELIDCVWSNEVWNFTYVWLVYLPLIARSF